MRELDRTATPPSPEQPLALERVAVVGRGRLGSALAPALRAAGFDVPDPTGRDERPPADADAVLLCVPDAEIAKVRVDGPLVGHTSGATPLSALPHPGAFGLHPLQTATGPGTRFDGCGCAIAGATPAALSAARELATRLGMVPFELRDDQRAAYHAAASIASNFLITLEAEAEQLASDAGIEGFDARRMLGPLVTTTVANWIELGPRRALTGPVARGDRATVGRQRAAIEQRRPQLVPLFDALVERTEALAT